MKKGAGKIFATGFLRSLIFVMLFAAISVGSYKLVMYFFGLEDTKLIETIPSVKQQTPIIQARIDEVSKHLIYCVDEDTGDIKKLILEIFDCENLMLYYITIPIKTQLTLSDSLHRELVLIKPSIPSFLKLSSIRGYLPDDTVFEYGVLMIEELLDIQISYYTVVSQSIYDTVFETEITGPKADMQQGSESSFPREVFSDGFLEYLHTINTETQLSNYIEELYSKIKSNLSFEDKLNYMESYINTSGKNIVFEVIAGKDSNSGYTIDEFLAAKQLKTYLNE